MAEINNINNIAREIVSNLDKQDGKEDGKIEASIWNKFVCKKQGNEIHNYINTNSAVKSVIAYLKREVTKTGQAIEDVANEWLKNVGGGDKTEIDETKFNKSKSDLTIKPVIIAPEEDDNLTNEIIQNHKEIADKATALLMDVANKNYRYSIVEYKDKDGDGHINRRAKLKDGRYIELTLYKQEDGKYKISECNISLKEVVIAKSNDSQLIGGTDLSINFDLNSASVNDYAHASDNERSSSYSKQNNETIQSYFKLLQKIFGDDIEV